jgi:hypothetical protein
MVFETDPTSVAAPENDSRGHGFRPKLIRSPRYLSSPGRFGARDGLAQGATKFSAEASAEASAEVTSVGDSKLPRLCGSVDAEVFF